ncbi:MFS transporter [Spirillospora sp. NPDC052269]
MVESTVSDAPPGTRPHRFGFALALSVIAACQLMMVLDNTVVTIALPRIQDGLGFSPTALSWVMNAYVVAFGGLMLLGGRTGDLLGRRPVFVVSVVAFTVASLLCGIAADGAWLLAARTLQGVAAAFASPAALALIAGSFEGERRARALGVYAGVSSVGWAAGMILGGLFTSWLSWRWVFFVNLPVGAAIALASPRVLPAPSRRPGRFDTAGALTSTLGCGALVYALVRVADRGWGDASALAASAVAAVLLAAFVFAESRASQPITPLRLFAGRTRTTALLARMCVNGAMMGMFFYLTQVLQRVMGYSALRTGLAFVPIAVAMLVSTRVAPRLAARTGHRSPAVVAALALAGGMWWLGRLGPDSGYGAGIVVPLVLAGLGMGVAFVLLTAIALDGVGAEDAGAASGLVTVSQQLGGALGMSVLVTAYGTAARGTHGTEARVFLHGARSAFDTAAILCLLAAVAVLAGLRRTGDGRTTGGRRHER